MLCKFCYQMCLITRETKTTYQRKGCSKWVYHRTCMAFYLLIGTKDWEKEAKHNTVQSITLSHFINVLLQEVSQSLNSANELFK